MPVQNVRYGLLGILALTLISCKEVESVYLVPDAARSVGVQLWYPADIATSDQRHPLIIFSHGYFGAPTWYQLPRELARAGYVVAAPFHDDYISVRPGNDLLSIHLEAFINNLLEVLQTLRSIEGYETISLSELINLFLIEVIGGEVDDQLLLDILNSNFEYRVIELDQALEVVLTLNQDKTSPLSGKVDTKAICALAHSFGANTVMQKVMVQSPYYDPRITAAVFLSPAGGFSDASQVTIPTLWVSGTLDYDSFYNIAYTSAQDTQNLGCFLSLREIGHLTFAEHISNVYQVLWQWSQRLQTALGFFKEVHIEATKNAAIKNIPIAQATTTFFNYWREETADPEGFKSYFTIHYRLRFASVIDEWRVFP